MYDTKEELKIDIPAGYEFAGVDDDAQQVVFTKIQPEYPESQDLGEISIIKHKNELCNTK